MTAAEAWIYRFGDIEVEPSAHRITRAGVDLGVEPKAYAVLVALLEDHGKALQRDVLLDRVWGHRHVTPGVLNRVVAQLRKALGDEAEHPRYIQTLHSLGYRFIAEVERVPVAAPDEPIEPAVAAVATPLVVEEAREPVSARALPSRRTRAIGIAAVLVVAALAIAGLHKRQAELRPAAASIAVLPFTNLSSQRNEDYFAEGLAEEMYDALAGVQGLKVASRLSSSAIGDQRADAKALGKRLGVATVLDASVRREGQRVRINAHLSDTRTGYTLWSDSYDRELSDVFATQSEIAEEVVKSLLGALPDQHGSLSKRLAPTRDIKAYDAYLKGLEKLRGPGDVRNSEHAISFFNQALAADGSFARAQAGVCRAELRRFELMMDSAAYGRAQEACMRASEMDPDMREVSLAFGDLHRVRGEFGKAVEYYAKAQDDPRLRPAVLLGLATAHAAQGRRELADGYFEQARALRPGDPAIHRAIGHQKYRDGDLPDAIEAFREAIRLAPSDADLWGSLGGLYLAAGNGAKASAAFERSIATKPTDAALSNYGTLKYQAGDYAAAVELFRRAAALQPKDFRLWGNLAEALLANPATQAQAREPLRRAAEMAERYIQVKPDHAEVMAVLAWYRANLGDVAAARGLMARAEALGTERGEVSLRNAQTLALLGESDAARERLAWVRESEIPQSRIAASPVLRRLPATDAPASGKQK
ncbi:TolB-like protein [Luteimonas cucumeris]|uniref:TolB-like protein n=1 Tax=Luteimonas cucumeris TaxID=985012 RepID=A0A562LB94_9GAMM|nr:tetratricopeptide repeat protein [Luteimonas cucumeris]TWI04927.1 TolB-like protein [Luteimonas cucumeris]